MAWGDTGNPARFGAGQADPATDDRALFAELFQAEAIAAFTESVKMRDKSRVEFIQHGKSMTFPKTWKATAEYMTAGQEMLGNDIDTTEITITVDGKLVAHTDIYDLDAKMSHFNVTNSFSTELGRALARTYDKNEMRAKILAARTAADGPFPGGHVIEDAALAPTAGVYDGYAWFEAVREAGLLLEEENIPEDETIYMVVNPRIFDAIRYARAPKSIWNGTTVVEVNEGDWIVLNRDFNAASLGITGFKEAMMLDRMTLIKSNLFPKADSRADATVYSKYRAAFDTSEAVAWGRDATATLVLMDIKQETSRDTRRQSDFFVNSMACGHGTLRPEVAVEFRSGAPTTT